MSQVYFMSRNWCRSHFTGVSLLDIWKYLEFIGLSFGVLSLKKLSDIYDWIAFRRENESAKLQNKLSES